MNSKAAAQSEKPSMTVQPAISITGHGRLMVILLFWTEQPFAKFIMSPRMYICCTKMVRHMRCCKNRQFSLLDGEWDALWLTHRMHKSIALFIVYWYSIGIFSKFFLPLLAGTGYILLTECFIVFPLYGFGKLVQNSEEIKHKLDK